MSPQPNAPRRREASADGFSQVVHKLERIIQKLERIEASTRGAETTVFFAAFTAVALAIGILAFGAIWVDGAPR
ncbi:MAG: hypothetical protein M9944_07855 [Rhizobiaceae bacterium]|nr:hypothetical protein [Rhizobiaceae bacterium]